MQKIVYRVCGEDTFAHEFFVVAEFDNVEAAEAKLKECRESVLDQTEELRDVFWMGKCVVAEK